jgi:hypothetical protein
MINKLKSKWVLICLALIVVGYLITMILRVLTPQATKLPASELQVTNLQDTVTSFNNISYEGDQPTLPTEFEIKRAALSRIDAALHGELVKAFELTQKPGTEIFEGPTYHLSQSDPQAWVLSINGGVPIPIVVDVPRAVQVAVDFAGENLPQLSATPYQSAFEYFFADFIHLDDSTQAEANMVSIPFATTVGPYPVFLENQDVFPVIYFVSSRYQVEKVVFNPLQLQLGETTMSSPPLSIEEAIENINNDKGAIIRAGQQKFGELNLTEITEAKLTKVSVEYRVDQELGLAYPFYRFSGTAENAAGFELDVDIVTPAVATRSQ